MDAHARVFERTFRVRAAAVTATACALLSGCLVDFEPFDCMTCLDAGAPADAQRSDARADDDGGGAADARPRVRVVEIARGFGDRHSCAVLEDGVLLCWGENGHGQLGRSEERALRPAPVPTLPPIEEVVLGFNHTCARSGGEVFCFGDNTQGQIGIDSSESAVRVPARVEGIDDAVQLAAGFSHTCVLRAGGSVACFGSVAPGREERIPVEMAGMPEQIVHIAAGAGSTGVVAGGEVWMMGTGACYRLGHGTELDVQDPVPIAIGGRVDSLALGDLHGCAVLENGALWCWGCNGAGMIGREGAHASVPQEIISGGVAAATAGFRNTCAERENGGVECWGESTYGMLADGLPIPERGTVRWSPAPVLTLPAASRVRVYWYHACALVDGTVRCWGQGEHGQVGDGSLANTSYPVTVID